MPGSNLGIGCAHCCPTNCEWMTPHRIDADALILMGIRQVAASRRGKGIHSGKMLEIQWKLVSESFGKSFEPLSREF